MSSIPNDASVPSNASVPNVGPVPNDASAPNDSSATNGPNQPTPAPKAPTQAPPPGPKKSALSSASAIAEQAKKDAKKKTANEKAALAAKLSRKAAGKKRTVRATTLHGLKETLREMEQEDLPPSDMDISDEESPRPAVGTNNPFSPIQETNQQTVTPDEPMTTNEPAHNEPAQGESTQEPDTQTPEAMPQETPPLPPAPATPKRPTERKEATEKADTAKDLAAELDSFSAAKVGLRGPNRVAFMAPTPDHVGENVQDLFDTPPATRKAQYPSSNAEPAARNTPAPTSASDAQLLSRLQLAAEYAPTPPTTQEALNEAEYTPGPFPTIHDANPVRALAFIDESQILSWNRTSGGKFIARLFDPTREHRPHATIAAIIQQAVASITNSPKARVATPIPKYPNPRPNAIPYSFLVFDISDEAAKAMIAANVWSSTAITFQAMELNPALPTYLFPVSGFADRTSNDTVRAILMERWLAPNSIQGFRDIIAHLNSLPSSTADLTEDAIVDLINSHTVSRLETKASGSYPRPTHRIHVDPTVLKSDHHLYAIRAHLRTLEYPTHYDGSGIPEPDWDCPLCNSIDHPKGMCPFSDVPGWNGPSRHQDKEKKTLRGGKVQTRGGFKGAARGRGAKRSF